MLLVRTSRFGARLEDEHGAVISIVSIFVLKALGLDIQNVFKTVETAVSNAPVTP